MFDNHPNLAIGTVAIGPTPATSGTILTLAVGEGARFRGNMPATLTPQLGVTSSAVAEIVYISTVSGDQVTCLRGQEGTTALPVAAGWTLIGAATAKTFTDIETAVNGKVNAAALATVATTGSYADLSTKPSIPTTFDGLADGVTNKAYTATEKSKVAGIAPGATQNASDAALRDRSTHTGSQAVSTVTGLQTALDAKVSKAGDTITGDVTLSAASMMIDGSSGGKQLYLKSSFNGGDDNGAVGNYDSTSRLILESYQRAGTNNYGEVIRVKAMKSDSKQGIAWYFPDSYDANGDPIGTLKPKFWLMVHADSTGHTGYHNHGSFETPDSKNLLRTRWGINFAPSGADDPTSPGVGLDKTIILTNNADSVFSTHYDTYQVGDTVVPTGPKGQASVRLKGIAGVPQDIEFGRNIGNDARRWVLRNSADAEAGSNAGANFQLNAYADSGTLLGIAMQFDRATGLVTIGATSTYRNGGLLINKANTGNALRINNTFAGGTVIFLSAQDTASRLISGQITSDTTQRFVLFADGKIEWGEGGTSSRDTNLYRLSADNLATDDKLNALGGLKIGSSSTTGYVWTATDTVGNGSWQASTGGGSAPDATTTSKGVIQLAGDLGGTAAAPTVTKTYTKSDVGLGNVDNTSDATKNAATATLTNKTLSAPAITDGTDITLGSTTGTKIGTATTQKLGFYGVTAVVQPVATTELITGLVSLGLRASGSAVPITTSGSVQLSGTTTLSGQAVISNAQKMPGVARTTSTTVTSSMARYHECDASTGAITMTLPSTTGNAGLIYHFTKTDSSANAVTIAGTINGATNYVLSNQYKYLEVRVNAASTGWLASAYN